MSRIYVSPGQMAPSLALRTDSPLLGCTELGFDDDRGAYFERCWPRLSSGEEVLWSVLAWLNGEQSCPSDVELSACLDGASLAAARAAVGSGVSA